MQDIATGKRRHDGAFKMKMQILGCAGGIGGQQGLTTCLRVDDDILLDAGTGIASLHLGQLAAIDHVFITHCHLDHTAGLALLADAVMGKRREAVTVHASEPVIAALKRHLFNWVLWPDFSEIPSADNPILRWQPLSPGATIDIGGRLITPLPVNHTDGSMAYHVDTGHGGFLFTGDMGPTPALWPALRERRSIRTVIVDCSFPNAESELAAKSKHFCPRSLIGDIGAVPPSVEFLIYHLKPGQEDLIMRELASAGGSRAFKAARCGDVHDF